jgi:hypothetical protein
MESLRKGKLKEGKALGIESLREGKLEEGKA